MTAIDPSQLPWRVSVDTGVFLRWLDKAKDADAPVCYAVLQAVVDKGGQIVLPAPAMAEILRNGHVAAIPHLSGLEVVAFDELAARTLASKLPLSALQQLKIQGSPKSLSFLKYDAMIVACAVRHRALLHIALDADHHKLCANAGLAVRRPHEFLAPAPKQLTLSSAGSATTQESAPSAATAQLALPGAHSSQDDVASPQEQQPVDGGAAAKPSGGSIIRKALLAGAGAALLAAVTDTGEGGASDSADEGEAVAREAATRRRRESTE